jgi:rhamnosyltransferase
MDEGMKVSVIIPTRNGGQYLTELFVILKEQSIKPAQILVVDSSSEDNTLKICEDFRVDIIHINAQSFDHGGTRNLAASRATGDIMIFMTQDAIFSDMRGIENLIRPLEDCRIAASYGRQMARQDASPIERFVRSFNYPPTGMIKEMDDVSRLGVKTFFFSNACSAIKRQVFEEVGGFPQKTIMNEDMFLAAKLLVKGYKIAYQADAVVYHSHNYSLWEQFQRYFDIGVFFNRNPWIRDLAKSEREGIRYLKEEVRFLSANRQKSSIPYALVDTMIRFLGYRMGLFEESIPLRLKKTISYNKKFWGVHGPSFSSR